MLYNSGRRGWCSLSFCGAHSTKAADHGQAGSSSGPSPIAPTHDSKPDLKAKLEPEPKPSGSSSRAPSPTPVKREPLSTIDSSRTTPRTAKSDAVVDSLRCDEEGGDPVRDKCVVMIYGALAGDSTAGACHTLWDLLVICRDMLTII